MFFIKKFRNRLESIYQGDQSLEDPHRWPFPGKSAYPTPKPPRNNTGDSTTSNSSSNSGGRSQDGYVVVGRAKYPPTIIPDPALMKNAFIPNDPTRVAVEEPDHGNPSAASRVSYVFPDSNHAVVHLALLECFRNLRFSANDLKLTGPAVAAHTAGGSPPAYSEEPRDEDIRARSHHQGENSGYPSGNIPIHGGDGGAAAETGGPGGNDAGPTAPASESPTSTERWDLFLQLAVTRFTVWWLSIDKVLQHAGVYTHHVSSGSTGVNVQLTKDYLPPLDVLLVWYAFMLHGSQEGEEGREEEESPLDHFDDAYKWACRNHVCKTFHPDEDSEDDDHRDARSLENLDVAIASARQQLENLAFPWVAIREVIDFERMEYRPTRASLNLFTTLSGQEADLVRYLAVPPAYIDHRDHLSPPPPPHSDRDEGGNSSIEPASSIFIEPSTGRPLDLVKAVKRLEKGSRSLMNRAHSLLWIRGPSLGGSLDRACNAYFEWQNERYAAAAARRRTDIDGGRLRRALTLDEEKEELYSVTATAIPAAADPTVSSRRHDRPPPRTPANLPFGVDLMWHTHRLFPAQYGHFCEDLRRRQSRNCGHSMTWPSAAPSAPSASAVGPGSTPSSSSDACECWACERIRDERPDFAFFHPRSPQDQQQQGESTDTDGNDVNANESSTRPRRSSTTSTMTASSVSSSSSSSSSTSSSSSSSASAWSAFSQDLVASPSSPPPQQQQPPMSPSLPAGVNAPAVAILRSLSPSQVRTIRDDIGFHRAVEKARRRYHHSGGNGLLPGLPMALPVREGRRKSKKNKGSKKDKKQHRRGGSMGFRGLV